MLVFIVIETHLCLPTFPSPSIPALTPTSCSGYQGDSCSRGSGCIFQPEEFQTLC